MDKVCALCKVQGADVNNVNISDKKGFTSLMNAIDNDHDQCARALLDAGADVNNAGAKVIPPLILATVCEHFKFVKMLLKEGADVNIINKKGATALI